MFSQIAVRYKALLLAPALLAALASAAAGDDVKEQATLAALKQKYGRGQSVKYPVWNQHTPAREELGRRLFFDAKLSDTGPHSCGTCHQPELGWSDGLPKAIGPMNQVRPRRTPTILNLAYAERLQWDGRANSLEEQVIINTPAKEIARHVMKNAGGYKALFKEAYPGEAITERTVAKAIATFERAVVSGPAPFDRWIAGDEAAISAAAKRGFLIFNQKGNCSTCHSTWRFTNDSLHDTGLVSTDRGRGKFQSNIRLMQFAFKTPTLRDVAKHNHFMHDGSLTSLREVVEHYDRGGAVRRESVSPAVFPLKLSEGEKADLVGFLETLTSDAPR